MEQNKNSLSEKIGTFIGTAKRYWNTPAKGNYIPYKEVASLSAAGFGAQWATLPGSTIALDAGNLLIGSSLEIAPLPLQYMLIIANILGIPIGIWRAWYIDNHNMKGANSCHLLSEHPSPFCFSQRFWYGFPFICGHTRQRPFSRRKKTTLILRCSKKNTLH